MLPCFNLISNIATPCLVSLSAYTSNANLLWYFKLAIRVSVLLASLMYRNMIFIMYYSNITTLWNIVPDVNYEVSHLVSSSGETNYDEWQVVFSSPKSGPALCKNTMKREGVRAGKVL